MNVLVFDIETIPDIEGGQRIYDLQGLDDKSTAKAMHHLQQQKTGSEFLPLYLHKIIAISVVYRGMGDDMESMVTVHSLGDENSTEAELLTLFFNEIEERTPTLVSWNGTGFDLPVIHYRTLKNGISAPGYWEKGSKKSDFRDDNYLSRYHERHTDLKDVLASYNRHASAPLDHLSTLLGFPGKNGMDGSMVWGEYQAGNITGIRDYCETDVLNTYLVYLQYQLMRGEIDKEKLDEEFTLLRDMLDSAGKESGKGHLQQFSKDWN
jgi:predicted PolB exonuclease-like 3'-5' exonuclease